MLLFHSMSTSARRLHYTYSQNVALEEHGGVRHELPDGEICVMAGGSPDHAALVAASCIGQRLARRAPSTRGAWNERCALERVDSKNPVALRNRHDP
jgi:hypothetical protein